MGKEFTHTKAPEPKPKPKFLTGTPKWASRGIGFVLYTWLAVIVYARLVDTLASLF